MTSRKRDRSVIRRWAQMKKQRPDEDLADTQTRDGRQLMRQVPVDQFQHYWIWEPIEDHTLAFARAIQQTVHGHSTHNPQIDNIILAYVNEMFSPKHKFIHQQLK